MTAIWDSSVFTVTEMQKAPEKTNIHVLKNKIHYEKNLDSQMWKTNTFTNINP